MDLESNCVYFVFVGNLALGKRIIQEHDFIVGKTGRSVVALKTTCLVRLYLMK